MHGLHMHGAVMRMITLIVLVWKTIQRPLRLWDIQPRHALVTSVFR